MEPKKGTVVIYGDFIGAVRYIGPVMGDNGELPENFVGIELAEPVGNCDGSLDQYRYFRTHQGLNYGLFLPVDDIDKIVTPFEMLEKLTSQHKMLQDVASSNQKLETLVEKLTSEKEQQELTITKLRKRVESLEKGKTQTSPLRSRKSKSLRKRKSQHKHRPKLPADESRGFSARESRRGTIDEFTFVNYDPKQGMIVPEETIFGSAERETVIDESETVMLDPLSETESELESESESEHRTPAGATTPFDAFHTPALQTGNSLAVLIEKVSNDAKEKLKMTQSHSADSVRSRRSSRKQRPNIHLVRSRSPPFRLKTSPKKMQMFQQFSESYSRECNASLSAASSQSIPMRPRSCPPPTDSSGSSVPDIPCFPDEIQSSSLVAVYSHNLTPHSSQVFTNTLLSPPGAGVDEDLPALVEYESPLPQLDAANCSGASMNSLKDESDHQMAMCHQNSAFVEHTQGYVLGDLFNGGPHSQLV